MRKKDATALYEVIAQTRERKGAAGGMTLPGWANKKPEADTPAESAEVEVRPPQEAPDPEPPVAVTPAPAEPLPAAAPAPRPPRPRTPVFSNQNGRVVLSLGAGGALATVAGLCVLLSVAFLVGRVTGTAGGETAVQAGVTDGGGEAAGGEQAGVQRVAREAGKYYLVIQTVKGQGPEQIQDAHRIAQWATQKGYPAEVFQLERDLIVWSTRPFASPRADDARAFAEQVHRLGKQYREQGGQYNFSQETNGQITGYFLQQRNP